MNGLCNEKANTSYWKIKFVKEVNFWIVIIVRLHPLTLKYSMPSMNTINTNIFYDLINLETKLA